MRSKPNYELKAQALRTNGLCHRAKKVRYLLNLGNKLMQEQEENGVIFENYDKWMQLVRDSNDLKNNDKLFMEAWRLNDASWHRQLRLRERINAIISKDAFFLTLTFTNKVLKETSEETRRKYVQRYLKGVSVLYVANIDYGKKKGREHYHAVVQMDRVDASLWVYGNLDYEKIYNPNEEALANYTDKLVNHAIKSTTKRCHVIYSR